MNERTEHKPEQIKVADLPKRLDTVSSLPDFRHLVHTLLPQISVDDFLYNFESQIRLEELFRMYGHKTRSGFDAKEIPVVILNSEGQTDAGTKTISGTVAIEPFRFKLADPDHIYYFNQHRQSGSFFATIDGEEKQMPALNRVPILGGGSEQYDYESLLWVTNNRGVFRGSGLGNNRTGDIQLPRIVERSTSQQ